MILLSWWWTAKNLLIVHQPNVEMSPKDMTGILATFANICRAHYIALWLECLELHNKSACSQRGSATSWQKDKWLFIRFWWSKFRFRRQCYKKSAEQTPHVSRLSCFLYSVFCSMCIFNQISFVLNIDRPLYELHDVNNAMVEVCWFLSV